MKKIRLAAVSFLNSRPITYALERGQGRMGEKFDLRYELPSRCADLLAQGEADLALLPSASYAAISDDLRIVPGIAVAGKGPVRTVLLVGQVPWERMDVIGTDSASRTSATLVQLLTRDRGLSPRFETTTHAHIMDTVVGTRGALMIGDPAFIAAERFPYVYDLGQEWTKWVGLPFVYAVWAGRPGAIDAEGVKLLQESLRLGLQHRAEIARGWAENSHLTPEACESYLQHNIRYQLGAEELSGATAFFDRAFKAGLLPRKAALRFFDDGRPERPITTVRTAPPLPVPRTGTDHPQKSLDALLTDAAAGQRLGFEDALRLYDKASTIDLGMAADLRRQALHGDGTVTYIIDRNVNYTNVCVTRCKFCNFYRPPGRADGYTHSKEVLAKRLQETVDLGGVQILLQGGLNPDLPLAYYEDLFRWMKANFPLAIHGLSPEEIRYIAELENMSLRGVIERLVAAGLDSIPGGGAEILDDEIRERISPLKCSTETWLEVMRQGHALGLRTTGTMVFGFGETPQHIFNHLEHLRALQDETAGFTAFICWPFQAEGTRLKLKDDTTAMRYLRVFALSRLYLDNFPNLQVSWPTMGPDVGQVALRFGGNDFGSAMIEENVVSQAGAVFKLSGDDIERYVREAGFVPRRRNMRYELLAARQV
ncbi:MAG: cyclic dehypoxanthinyl futalosine synthase [Deltaproteobacteria bacterium]|nr:cyclic dehypoxanthinyl futalosine synthase [Deltaproteobacteria bacterium]